MPTHPQNASAPALAHTPDVIPLDEIRAAYANLCTIGRGREAASDFVKLAKNARYLDASYLGDLITLMRSLQEGHFNGSLVQIGEHEIKEAGK